jgi:hypothetical protein
LLARAAGMRLVARYGALAPLAPAETSEEAYRLISVIAKP